MSTQNILRRLKKKFRTKRSYDIGHGVGIGGDSSVYLHKFERVGTNYGIGGGSPTNGDISDSTDYTSHEEDNTDYGPTPISSPLHMLQNGELDDKGEVMLRSRKGGKLDDEQSTTTGTLTPGSVSKCFEDDIPYADDGDETVTLNGGLDGYNYYESTSEMDSDFPKSPISAKKKKVPTATPR